jgi:hypothetical protein
MRKTLESLTRSSSGPATLERKTLCVMLLRVGIGKMYWMKKQKEAAIANCWKLSLADKGTVRAAGRNQWYILQKKLP